MDVATVVQRYITRPMLIEDLKFDLRLYFLVAGKKMNDSGLDLRCFLFRDGLVRLCTTPYEPPTADTMNQKCMHLTNYAVNKNSKAFQQNTGADDDGSGSKRSLRWFLSWVAEQFGEKERRKLWLKLMGLCVKTVLTVSPTLEAEYEGAFPRDLTGGQMDCRCFEILGIDVMLDGKRKPYLIEVNHLPSFTADSPLDEDIKTRLVNQTLDLTCQSLTGKDKKRYNELVKERREGNGLAPSSEAEVTQPASASTCLLDLPMYKDFERAYPPPEGAPKLAAQLEAIRAKTRELFKPVHVTKTKRGSVEQETSNSKPPLLPRSSAPMKAADSNSNDTPSSNQLRRPSQVPSGGPPPPRQPRPLGLAQQRSRSAPGPPRCALPPISKSSPANSAGGSRGRSPSRGEAQLRRAASAKPARACLQLKSAQILL
eukprot:TRINITY_DN3431_c1_g1_i2.p1 TRINITY_DN3431_c1_g1~~TRINITY_DN3431_c1_g1_i2.p1  ORF type:complete len:499 (+),score=95.01 TRINITY_DN3431_c1_g1_i2:218-1498(+)